MSVDDNASLDDIDKAPTEPITDDPRAGQESALFKAEQEKFNKELGWLGRPFGGRSEKPGNISALVVVLTFVLIVLFYCKPPTPDMGVSFERLFGGLTSIVTLVLGYLFGSNDRAK